MIIVSSSGTLRAGLGVSRGAALTWVAVGILFSVTSCTQVSPNNGNGSQTPAPIVGQAGQTEVIIQQGVPVTTVSQQSVLSSPQYQPLDASQIIASAPPASSLHSPVQGTVISADSYELQSLRQRIASRDADRDPNRRPRSIPGTFPKERWPGTIPFFPSGTQGELSSDFGWRKLKGRLDFHGGIDVIAKPHQAVTAVRGGEVVWVNYSGYWGGIVISSGDRMYTYWHTRPTRRFSVGDQVNAGEVIARVTDAGGATHLHYAVHLVSGGDWEARSDHNAIDPLIMYRETGML